MIVGPDGIDIGGPDYDGPSEFLYSIETVKIEDLVFDLALYEGAATLGYEELADVAKLYTAYFNRAPAAEGLLYWGTRYAEGMSLAQMAQSFFVQPEAQALYGNVADPGALVDAVFQNLLGRLPAADGRTYWTNQLESGEVREATLVLAVINGAEAPTGSPGDAAYLRDKADIGLYFAGLKGLNARDRSDDVLALYDGTQEGLIAARDAVDAIHAEEVDSGLTMPMVGVIADPFADLV